MTGTKQNGKVEMSESKDNSICQLVNLRVRTIHDDCERSLEQSERNL